MTKLSAIRLPVVAIVGRPNVGKSSLLNCLAGRRVSIVDEMPGVTRDRVSTIIVHRDVTMEVVDTGGVGIVDRDDLDEHVERQIAQAIRDASLILFITDVREGVTPLDREVARRLRERSRQIPVILVANKADNARAEEEVHEFHGLGMGDPVAVSATHHRGTKELLDTVVERLGPTGVMDVEPVMKLAVVGRQNVGKSTLVNAIAQEDRMIVSEVPGTTRDSVDVYFEKDGRRFVVIDTAGVKKISRAQNAIEVYSQLRTEAAIRRADVALLLLDASQDITRADKRLGDFIAAESRICIIVANKWDLAKSSMPTSGYAEYAYDHLRGLRYAPMAFITAKDSRNIQSSVDLAQSLFKRSLKRVGTGQLNRVLEAVRDRKVPRVKGGKVPRLFYATQVATSPPTFAVFVNDPGLFPEDYRRYVENSFREALGFDELPLRLLFRPREREETGEK